jgi:Zn-dependent protease
MYINLRTADGLFIGFDFTLVVVSVLLTCYLAAVFLPLHYSAFESMQDWTVAIIGTFLFISSVFIHQMAHMIVAMIVGLNVRHIIFSALGGVLLVDTNHNKDQNIDRFHMQLKVALAGPAASFLLSALFGLSWWLEFQDMSGSSMTGGPFLIKEAVHFLLYYSAVLNAFLAFINLVPLFPFDGGSILYAFLLRNNGKSMTALKISRSFVVLLSCLLLGLGSYFLFFGSVFIGLLLLTFIWILQSGLQIYRSSSNMILTKKY